MKPRLVPPERPPYANRADGWPLCPQCGEDELYSLFPWDGSDPKPPMQAWIDHGLRCYRCGFASERGVMHSFDHFPWDSATDPARLATIRDALSLASVPLPVVPPLPTPRFVLRYGVYVCSVCGMAKEYCRGHTPAPPVQGDGDASSLERRARECRGR
jgi:hypothetical protein